MDIHIHISFYLKIKYFTDNLIILLLSSVLYRSFQYITAHFSYFCHRSFHYSTDHLITTQKKVSMDFQSVNKCNWWTLESLNGYNTLFYNLRGI